MKVVDRAKQFLPFDALSGWRAELESREEKISRVPHHEITDELTEELSLSFSKIRRGSVVEIDFFENGHYYLVKGQVSDINAIYKYLIVEKGKIFFDDIYKISIISV